MKTMTCNQLGGACDKAHMGAMNKMMKWFEEKRAEFDALTED